MSTMYQSRTKGPPNRPIGGGCLLRGPVKNELIFIFRRYFVKVVPGASCRGASCTAAKFLLYCDGFTCRLKYFNFILYFIYENKYTIFASNP